MESDVLIGKQDPICNHIVCVDWVLQSAQFCVDWVLQSVQFCVDWVLQSVQFCVHLYGCRGYSCLPGWPELLFVGVWVTGQMCLKKTFSSSGLILSTILCLLLSYNLIDLRGMSQLRFII